MSLKLVACWEAAIQALINRGKEMIAILWNNKINKLYILVAGTPSKYGADCARWGYFIYSIDTKLQLFNIFLWSNLHHAVDILRYNVKQNETTAS